MADINAVARAAGVSIATVSRAYSAPGLLREDTRTRVLSAARKLGYEPNRAARALVSGKTKVIGLIVPDIANPVFPPMIKSAQLQARRADYAVFLADTDENAGIEPELLEKMSRDVDGVVFLSSRMPNDRIAHFARTLKIVTVSRDIEGVATVLINSSDGYREAIDHLAALGHRRVAYVNGPLASWSNQEKRRAVQLGARRHGIDLTLLGPFSPTSDGGVLAADAALASGVTATIAFNDLVAIGMLNRFSERGVLVPEHMSVTGCDDIPLSAKWVPGLTTVAVPAAAAGREAIDMLLRLINDEADPSRNRVTLSTQLIVRKSTGKPPSQMAKP